MLPGTDTQTYTRVTRQGRMALTGDDALNTVPWSVKNN